VAIRPGGRVEPSALSRSETRSKGGMTSNSMNGLEAVELSCFGIAPHGIELEMTRTSANSLLRLQDAVLLEMDGCGSSTRKDTSPLETAVKDLHCRTCKRQIDFLPGETEIRSLIETAGGFTRQSMGPNVCVHCP
jgi:hypothetical protein